MKIDMADSVNMKIHKIIFLVKFAKLTSLEIFAMYSIMPKLFATSRLSHKIIATTS